LGDYPAVKWKRFAGTLPADLSSKSVLDIGCNAGFYTFEMKRRGATRVLGIDTDERYLAQARFAAEVNELDIEFIRLSVYEVANLGETFDLVIFMGVFYHLRHPLLALDLIHEHVARDLLLFQSMQRGSEEVMRVAPDHDFAERRIFDEPGFPKLHFIENRYSRDPTNWWIPNRACSEALLRSAGFEIVCRAEEEVYLCRRRNLCLADWDHRAVYPSAGPVCLIHPPRTGDGGPAGLGQVFHASAGSAVCSSERSSPSMTQEKHD
jgi:tRNA (mo5U34)-methyltransferase